MAEDGRRTPRRPQDSGEGQTGGLDCPAVRSLLPLLLALGASATAERLPALVQSVTHPSARWAFSVDSQRAVAVDSDGAAAVVFPRRGPPRAVKFSENGKLRAPLVTPEGRVLAVGLVIRINMDGEVPSLAA